MTKTQVLVVLTAIVLFVLLLFARKLPLAEAGKGSEADIAEMVAVSDDDFNKAIESVDPILKDAIKQQLKANSFDSVARIFMNLNHIDLAAYIAEKKANSVNSANAWYEAGEDYRQAIGSAPPIRRKSFAGAAIRCLQKSLAIQPTNLDAKASLGACYVEGTADPMKGIGLLREVVQQDSTNLKAQLNLAFFSMKSNQFAKAIDRFNKVIAIQPQNYELLLYLADAYEKAGEKENAITTLEKFVANSGDEGLKTEVKTYINKLKK